jgi:hypothetical protein
MRGHKGPVKAYVQRDREGSTHIYSSHLNTSDNTFSPLLWALNKIKNVARHNRSKTNQPNATLTSISLLAYIHFSQDNGIVLAETVRVWECVLWLHLNEFEIVQSILLEARIPGYVISGQSTTKYENKWRIIPKYSNVQVPTEEQVTDLYHTQ